MVQKPNGTYQYYGKYCSHIAYAPFWQELESVFVYIDDGLVASPDDTTGMASLSNIFK